MYLLKKVFQLREKAHPDHEKPFLEHLEDLRIMVTRIVITLALAMLVCFAFQEQLMQILRRPVNLVWMTELQETLPNAKDRAPRPVDVDTWERAKVVANAAMGLSASEREAFDEALDDENLRFHVRSAEILRAVTALPEEEQIAFVNALKLPDEMRQQVLALQKKSPSVELDARGNVREMSALRPTETFMLSMKLSFFAGVVVAFPLLLMFIMQFVLPGLHKHERRVLWPSLAIGFGLFLCGVLFAYFVVLPKALTFFYQWSSKLGVANDWRIGEYITFATQFTLLFGLSFELPVVVMVLVKLGLLSYETMQRTRSYAILAIFVAAAVITPTPDAFTLLLMALPMVVLYEICIWLAWWDARKERKREALEGHGSSANHSSEDSEAGDDGWSEEEPVEDPDAWRDPDAFRISPDDEPDDDHDATEPKP